MAFSMKNCFASATAAVKRHAPDILMGVGTAGVVGGTVMACRATLKLPGIMDTYRDQKAQIQTGLDEDGDQRTDKEMAKDLRRLKLRTAGKVALNYGPAVAVEGLSLGGMWTGYGKMKTACVSLGAAYMALHNGFEKYRENVRTEFGEEVDDRMMYGYHQEEVVHQAEDGTETTETVTVYPNHASDMPSPYARYFCYGEADGAERSFDYNDFFLHQQEDAINRTFRAVKGLYLNDVYEILGVRKSIKGNRVGWIYDKNKPVGDQYIDLRIRVVYREKLDENGRPCGWEKVHMIDPNVAGPVDEEMLKRGLVDA